MCKWTIIIFIRLNIKYFYHYFSKHPSNLFENLGCQFAEIVEREKDNRKKKKRKRLVKRKAKD